MLEEIKGRGTKFIYIYIYEYMIGRQKNQEEQGLKVLLQRYKVKRRNDDMNAIARTRRKKEMSLSNKFKCINLDNTNQNLMTRIFSKIC